MQARVAVLGAGTMGAGIAQVALQAGFGVVLYDLAEVGLERARHQIVQNFGRLVSKARLSADVAADMLTRLALTTALHSVKDVELVIEAAPEVLEIKRDLFRFLDAQLPESVLLATNTSSLSVTAIAADLKHGHRLVGLHFFNPAPVMKLVEIVQGLQTSDEAIAQAEEWVHRFEKTPVLVRDTPGFLVNRVARPYYGEALKVLGDHALAPSLVDAVMTDVAGFRMGPFALMDLIGIDVNFAVTCSVYDAFFQEPRFRPHPIQAHLVAARHLGRKSGKGFYDYGDQKPVVASPQADVLSMGDARLAIAWIHVEGAWAQGCLATLHEAGHTVCVISAAECANRTVTLANVDLVIDLGVDPVGLRQLHDNGCIPTDVGCLVGTTPVTATEWQAQWGRPVARVNTWFDWRANGTSEVSLAQGCTDKVASQVTQMFVSIGQGVLVVPDVPGFVSGRILAMIVNEACWVLQQGVAGSQAVETAMRLGANYPQGPLAWGDRIGAARIVALLDTLIQQEGDRYRAAPRLRQHALAQLFLLQPV